MVAKTPDPSPQEIQNLCDNIQLRWSQKDRTRRRVIVERRWIPPMVLTDDLSQEVNGAVECTTPF